jgi:hypothetical protein
MAYTSTDELAPVRAYTKKQLVIMLDMDHRTLSRYLNRRFLDEMEQLGYRPKDRLLTTRQVRFIFENLGWPSRAKYFSVFPK